MKKLLALLLLAALLLPLVPVSGEVVFAFEQLTYEVVAKKSFTLTPILQGAQKPQNAKYTWESSDKTVATVQNGKVTGVKRGEAVITVTLSGQNGESYQTSCTVCVTQPITSIKPEGKDGSIDVQTGTKYQLKPEILPEDADNRQLVYTSSDTKVATVDQNGVVTMKEDGGTVKITMEAADGSGKKAVQKITGSPFIIAKEEIVLTERKLHRITVASFPSSSVFKFTPVVKWDKQFLSAYTLTKDDPKQMVYDYFTIRPLKPGTTTLTFSTYPMLWSPAVKFTVKVKIEESACYTAKSFPKLAYDKAMADPAAVVGQRVSLEGAYVETYVDDNGLHCYKLATKGKDGNVIIARSAEGKREFVYAPGDKVKIWGAFAEPLVYKTETGLNMTTLVIDIERIDDIFFPTDEVDVQL